MGLCMKFISIWKYTNYIELIFNGSSQIYG